MVEGIHRALLLPGVCEVRVPEEGVPQPDVQLHAGDPRSPRQPRQEPLL